ncbi:hypothetical protein [Aurantimicrobium minutum]|uniref:hypothetical protein n=1 Tax=Aurantimicrobium minutum TaxID=708131 RepID=UPI002474D586|nr:hypothetical protein [Aurantimicrobium minutum]MDH6423413.1 hypothetical protein [Aurantimicrobium minutum]
MNDNDEFEVDDEVLETAAGGVVLHNLLNSPPQPNYTVNETIYFQSTITDTVS